MGKLYFLLKSTVQSNIHEKSKIRKINAGIFNVIPYLVIVYYLIIHKTYTLGIL